MMKYLKLLLVLALVGILFYFFFQDVDMGEVMRIIKGLPLHYPIIFLAGLYLQFYIRSYRWGLLLKNHKPGIPLFTLYSYTAIGFFLSTLIPGRVGEPARGILLATEVKISRSYGLASVVLDRLIDISMIICIFIVSLFFLPVQGMPMLEKLRTAAYFALPFIVLVYVFFYMLNTEKVFGRVEKVIRAFCRLIPVRFREKAVVFITGFVRGLRINLSLGDYVKLIFSSIMVWVFLIPFYWYLMVGFGFGNKISLLESIPYFSIIVASAAIPTPGMAGSFDAFSKQTLVQLYGVEPNMAAAYTLLAHFFILLVMVVPGMIAFFTKRINFKMIRGLKEKEVQGNTAKVKE